VSPLTRALQKRFEEISRSELQRLRKKTAGLEPDERAAVDAFTVEVMHAIAARATERLQGPDSDRLATMLARLFGVNERHGSIGTPSSQN
jgi:glutamyl-tRNA reductase